MSDLRRPDREEWLDRRAEGGLRRDRPHTEAAATARSAAGGTIRRPCIRACSPPLERSRRSARQQPSEAQAGRSATPTRREERRAARPNC